MLGVLAHRIQRACSVPLFLHLGSQCIGQVGCRECGRLPHPRPEHGCCGRAAEMVPGTLGLIFWQQSDCDDCDHVNDGIHDHHKGFGFKCSCWAWDTTSAWRHSRASGSEDVMLCRIGHPSRSSAKLGTDNCVVDACSI